MGQAARRIGLHGVSAMLCKFSMLRRKEVINLCDGCRLGCVGDLDVQVPEGTVKGIIVFGPCRFFGLFGRGEDFYVPWDCIQKFGSAGDALSVYFLKLSFRDTLRLNTRCSAVLSRLSRQK